MIIRRRHTANFTTIGNDLFDDERLAADELGVLAFLLSRPNDWEVRRPALMRRFKVGRDAIRRIIANWIKTGWCVTHRTRLSNGTFHIVYEIRDEPGPELSEEQVKRALSLVSSEAADDGSFDEAVPEPPDDGSGHAAHARDAPEPCVSPHTCQPYAVDRTVVTRRGPIEGLLKTDSVKPESTQAIWANVEKTWPSGHLVSPLACENHYAALSIEEREKALRGIEPYLSDCRVKNRKVCDLSTYLKEKRWRGKAVTHPVKAYEIHGHTPQAYRWLEYRRATGQPTSFMENLWQIGKPWYSATEWPPALSQARTPSPQDTPASHTRDHGP